MQYLKKQVREKILAAAKDEFKEFGYSDASIRNISDNAEISLGNIYRYFANKEDLFLTIVNPFLDTVKHEIEENTKFSKSSMKDISEFLVGFLMQHSDEIIIIRKSDAEHHDKFVEYIIGVTSGKIRELLNNSFPEIASKLQNDGFYDAVAEGFLTSLFKVIRTEDSREVQQRNAREVITFYFGHMIDRYYHFEN